MSKKAMAAAASEAVSAAPPIPDPMPDATVIEAEARFMNEAKEAYGEQQAVEMFMTVTGEMERALTKAIERIQAEKHIEDTLLLAGAVAGALFSKILMMRGQVEDWGEW